MANYIENPIKDHKWDPSKGDYFSDNIIREDKLYVQKQRRKKMLIFFLGLIHILFLTSVFFIF